MGLFNKIKNPVFLKEDSSASAQLTALQELAKTASGSLADQLDLEIKCVSAGIYGEESIHFELENSHIPMLILHDLYLEREDLSAQIDYLIITRKNLYILECKNLYGNIEITNNGEFIRTVSFGRNAKKEGIYSPITQNRRHLELIKQIRSEARSNLLTKALFERFFYDNYHSLVVLANPKTILNAKYAKKEIKEQVIRADQLAERIRKTDAESKPGTYSEKDMDDLAQFFLSCHKQPKIDYTEKFRAIIDPSIAEISPSQSKAPICPKCGGSMLLRKATKGTNVGSEFWGCSNFPKCRCIMKIE